jgi:hypothetical protein
MVVGILTLTLPSCFTGMNQNRVAIFYAEPIQKMPGGIDGFWSDGNLKQAFISYWNQRYSDKWKDAYSKEAPYFREIINRNQYENVIKGAVSNHIEGIEIEKIQRVTADLYEIHFMLKLITSKNEKNELFFKDQWVRAGGDWYHVMKDPFLFPKAS